MKTNREEEYHVELCFEKSKKTKSENSIHLEEHESFDDRPVEVLLIKNDFFPVSITTLIN